MIEKIRIAIITFILLLYMRVFHNLLSPHPESSDTSNVHSSNSPLVMAILFLAYALLLLLVMPSMRKVTSIIFHDALILAMLLLIILSVFWSVDTEFSLRRACLFLASTVLAVHIGQRYDVYEIQRIFRNTILIMLAASAFLLLVAPRIVLDPENPGLLRGVMSHKNAFGLYIGLLAVIFLAGGMSARRPRVLNYIIFACLLGLMFLSRSGTAFVSLAAVVGMFPLLRILQRKPWLLLPKAALGLLLVAPFALTLTIGFDSGVGSVLGKNATLTGRTKLWSLLIEAVEQRPIQGYGYDAYLGSQGPEWSDTTKKVKWLPAHAHSGYIQIALGMGLLGLGLFFALLLKCIRRTFVFARENPTPLGLLPLAVLIYLILQNFTETTFLESSGLVNVWFFATYFSMSRYPRLAEMRSAAEPDQYEILLSGGLPTPSPSSATLRTSKVV